MIWKKLNREQKELLRKSNLKFSDEIASYRLVSRLSASTMFTLINLDSDKLTLLYLKTYFDTWLTCGGTICGKLYNKLNTFIIYSPVNKYVISYSEDDDKLIVLISDINDNSFKPNSVEKIFNTVDELTNYLNNQKKQWILEMK